MRDNRASRVHAHVVLEHGEYWIEDLNSRHGTYVNGSKIQRHKLQDSDRIEFRHDRFLPIDLHAGRRAGDAAARELPGA